MAAGIDMSNMQRMEERLSRLEAQLSQQQKSTLGANVKSFNLSSTSNIHNCNGLTSLRLEDIETLPQESIDYYIDMFYKQSISTLSADLLDKCIIKDVRVAQVSTSHLSTTATRKNVQAECQIVSNHPTTRSQKITLATIEQKYPQVTIRRPEKESITSPSGKRKLKNHPLKALKLTKKDKKVKDKQQHEEMVKMVSKDGEAVANSKLPKEKNSFKVATSSGDLDSTTSSMDNNNNSSFVQEQQQSQVKPADWVKRLSIPNVEQEKKKPMVTRDRELLAGSGNTPEALPFALRRNMWERRSLAPGFKFRDHKV